MNQAASRRSAGEKLVLIFATGFGFGYSPVASGTAGAVWGVPLAWLINTHLAWGWQAAAAALLSLLAVPICDVAERAFGTKDDGRIVADEYLTFPLCMIGLPPTAWVLAGAFVSHRVFDILKPPPARRAQDLPGGWGIAIDDILASLYALAFNHAAYWAVTKYLIAGS